MNLSRSGAGKFCLMALLTLTLSACFPISEHPIAGEPMDNLDDIFSGIWEGTLGDGPATALFMQQSQDDTGTFHIGGLVVGHHEERLSLNEGWLEFEGEVVVIGDEVFLSALLNQMNGKPSKPEERGYHLFRLVLTENTMKLVRLNDLVVTELINRGALEGQVDRSPTLPDIHLTSSSKDLRHFLTTADLSEVFSSPFASFTRKR